jgi:hypothetical protein
MEAAETNAAGAAQMSAACAGAVPAPVRRLALMTATVRLATLGLDRLICLLYGTPPASAERIEAEYV